MAVCTLLVAGPASADEPGRDGQLRVAHLSPDSPAVDVALAPSPTDAPLTDPGDDLAHELAYGDVSAFAGLAPGSYALSIRAAGSSPTEPPALSTRVEVPSGGALTVAVTGLFADLALQTLPDDLTPPPPASARVRVLAAAAGAPGADVSLASGTPLAGPLAFPGASAAVTVPAGATDVVVDGGPDLHARLPVEFAAGSVVTVLVLDAPDGGLTVREVQDAAGPATVPTGAVEAGSGPPPAQWPGWAVAGLAVAGLGANGRRSRTLLVLAATATSLATVPSRTPAPVSPALRSVSLIADHRPAPSSPVRVRIPAVDVDSPLAATGLDRTGALVPPAEGAGWYAEGPVPGDVGPAVLTGHVDGGGAPAVFYRLRDLVPGADVLVARADGSTVRFVVTAVARYPKDTFPTARVYGPTSGPELRLITCGGSFDRSRGSYRDNLVVYAVRG